jgi:hypothetical protein
MSFSMQGTRGLGVRFRISHKPSSREIRKLERERRRKEAVERARKELRKRTAQVRAQSSFELTAIKPTRTSSVALWKRLVRRVIGR